MATERIQIIVTSKGTVTVKKDIASIGDTAKKSASGVDLLKGALGGLTVGYLANEFIKFSDSALRVQNSLTLAGLSGEEFTKTQDRLYAAAIKNGQVAEDLTVVYRKMSDVQDQLGVSQDAVISTTEGIAAAMKLSTAGTAAQAGALQQLGQLLGGNMVQAQEYNSLIDGAYPLLQAAANGSREWGGSVAALTQDVKASNVTVAEFFTALRVGLKDTEALAQSVPLTIGQAFVSLNQSFQQWIATSTTSSAAARLLSSAIQGLGNNMATVAPLAIALGAAIVAALVGSAIVSAIASVTTLAGLVIRLGTSFALAIPQALGFAAALVVNPITLWIAGIAAAVAIIGSFIIYLVQGQEGLDALAESARVAAEEIKSYFSDLFVFGDNTNPTIEFRGEAAAADLKAAGADIGKSIASAVKGANPGKDIEKASEKGAGEYKKSIEKASTSGAKEFETAGSKNADKLGATMEKSQQAQTNINDVFVAKFEGTGRNIYDLWNNWGDSFIDSFGTTIGDLLVKYQKAMTDNLKAQAELFRAQAEQLKLENEYIKDTGTKLGTADNSSTGSGKGGSGKTSTSSGTLFGSFAKGGEKRVGGSGGTDSQLVNLRATPNETVRVMTPEQRSAEAQAVAAPAAAEPRSTQVINLFDPAAILAAMQTAEGRDVMVNVVKANRDEFASILGVA